MEISALTLLPRLVLRFPLIFSVLISVLVSAVDISGRERQASLLVFDEIVELNVMDRWNPNSGGARSLQVVDQEGPFG